MLNSARPSIDVTISEFAAALTTTAKWPDLPGKLKAFSESQEASCHAVGLEMVAELVEIERNFPSSFFKTYVANFVQALFTIARASEAKDGVRQMVVEVLLCIVDHKDLSMCLSTPEFTSELVRILLEVELNVEDDGDWIEQDNAAIDADTILDHNVSESCLKQVASRIGEENVKNIIFGYISEYLKKDEWQYKLVAIQAISETAEYLPKEGIVTFMDEIVEILMVQLNNTCQAIGPLALEVFKFRKSYAKVILPLLIKLFDVPSPRVQSKAVAAFNSIAKGIGTADLMPFTDQVINKLLERIKPENTRMVREEAFDGIAWVACVIKKKFMKYYSSVVQAIKGIVVVSSEERREIRGKAIKCIDIITESVRGEILPADAHEVMQALLRIVGAGLEPDHPLQPYIQRMFRQICRTLKGEFVPYLPHLIPNALKVLNIEPQPVNDEEVDVDVMAIVADGKCPKLKNSKIKEIILAVDLLSTFIEVLGKQFGEYLVPAAQSLLPLLSIEELINEQFEILEALANVFTVARHSSDPATRQMLSVWVAAVLEKVFKDLGPCDSDADITLVELIRAQAATDGLRKCLHNAGENVLNAQQVEAICEKVLRLMKESNQRRAITAILAEKYCRKALFKLIGVVISFHADLYLQAGAELCRQFIETHLDPNCSPSDRALALYVFDNVLEHLKDKGTPLWPIFASRLVECINDPDPVVRQAAAHGVIQAAKCPQFPAEMIQIAATQLFALISATQLQEQAFLSATDKMIAALGTIVVYRSSCLQPSPKQFLNLWINNLPLKVDYEEGRRTHGDLVDLLVQKSHEVFGRENENLPKLAAICTSIYWTNFTTAKTKKEIKDFMQKIWL